ncbi:MAG TPA: hypothetical protein VN253_08205 [Kofleriaceae bacterium]|nr:hypothetical protein [Kofleriaceae bacterium]
MSNAAPQRKPGEANPIVQLAILVAILAVVLNAGFYFLSESYFEDRVKRFGLQELARLDGARVDFAVFTVLVGLAAVAAVAFPRWVGHAIPALAAVLSLIASMAAFSADLPLVLSVALLLASGIFGLLIRQSLKGSRAGWACLASLCLVFGVVTLFGAPKVRGLFGVGLWIAMIVPGAFGIATAALGLLRAEYREPEPSSSAAAAR